MSEPMMGMPRENGGMIFTSSQHATLFWPPNGKVGPASCSAT
jgi:hypothetical protein